MSNKRRRWYGMIGHGWKGATALCQIEGLIFDRSSQRSIQLPEPIVKMAAEEYNRQGYDQSYEVLQRRGGLGVLEILALLADALDHERGNIRGDGSSGEVRAT